MTQQCWNVFRAGAQWRQLDANDIQPVIQVLAKQPALHPVLKILVSSRDDADIDPNRCLPTHPVELTFSEHQSDLDEPVILSVEFELDAEAPPAVLQRMRKAWIVRKASEPLSFQAGVRLFRNPPGQTAATLIDRAHMTKAKAGGAELSERNSNYAVAHPGRYRINGGGWQAIPATLTVAGAPAALQVVEAQPVLVGDQ